jgi:hypothetical protein
MAETKREKIRADEIFLMACSMDKKKAEHGVSV